VNALLWVVQVILALLLLAGGGFKFLNPNDPARQIKAAPPVAWRAIGIFEVLGAVLLIVPAAMNWMPALTTFAAAALAVENLGLSALYARYSRKLVAANPLVYAVPLALLAAFLAYGRSALSPLV
jgi:DoxX-like protein